MKNKKILMIMLIGLIGIGISIFFFWPQAIQKFKSRRYFFGECPINTSRYNHSNNRNRGISIISQGSSNL